MADTTLDLISMADIARLAGQRPATVGNWKSRNPDFPPERGRGTRGPLYDRAEVIAWLEATNRLDKQPHDVAAVWNIVSQLKGRVRIEDALQVLLVLLALRSQCTPAEWQELRSEDPNQLDEAVRSAIRLHFPFADKLLPAAKMPPEFIEAAVSMSSAIGRDRLPAMADALLEQAANAFGTQGGMYLTPKSVRKLIIDLAEPTGSVYNPATGMAQLLVDAANNAAPAVEDSGKALFLEGQEVDYSVWAMAQLNLAIHGMQAVLPLGDVFTHDWLQDERADRVITVPPWNQKLSFDVRSKDPRWVFGEPGTNDGNSAWIQHCLYHLADEGRAVLVLPNGALSEAHRAGRIRQRIIKAGLLDAVIALPPGLFAWTSIPAAILVFSRRGTRRSTQPASLMIDLSDLGERQGRQTTTLSDDLIDEVAQTYRQWAAGYPPEIDNAAVAEFDEIAANDFVIIPARYLSVVRDAPDLAEAMRRRSDLLRRFEAVSAVSEKADEQLIKLLETT
jgi:type I restriction-modification system DNA methylase subunit